MPDSVLLLAVLLPRSSTSLAVLFRALLSSRALLHSDYLSAAFFFFFAKAGLFHIYIYISHFPEYKICASFTLGSAGAALCPDLPLSSQQLAEHARPLERRASPAPTTTRFKQPVQLRPCQHGTGRVTAQGPRGRETGASISPCFHCLNECLCYCMCVRACVSYGQTHIRAQPTDQKPEDQMLSPNRTDTISNFLRRLQIELPFQFALA